MTSVGFTNAGFWLTIVCEGVRFSNPAANGPLKIRIFGATPEPPASATYKLPLLSSAIPSGAARPVLPPAIVVVGEMLFEIGVGVGEGEPLGDALGVGVGEGVGDGEVDGVGVGDGIA